MKRAIDTIVHDQADGPVPADHPAPEIAAPALTDPNPVPADTSAAPADPDVSPADTAPTPADTTTSKRRRGGVE